MRLSEPPWAEQLRTWYNLDPLHLSLCNGSNSPRGNEQRNVTARTALSRTASNSIELLSSRQQWWASHRTTLLVTGAAYSIQLTRDFVLLILELATVGMVVVWIDPHPGSGYLSSVARSRECQRWSNVEGWWPDNWESELSVVAINVYCPRWLSQIWGFLVASPTLRGTSPLGRAAVPAFVTSQHAEKCPPAWKQCGLWPRYILYGGTSLAFSTSGAHQSQSDLT